MRCLYIQEDYSPSPIKATKPLYYPKFNIAKPFLLQYQPVSNFNLRYCVLQSRIFPKTGK